MMNSLKVPPEVETKVLQRLRDMMNSCASNCQKLKWEEAARRIKPDLGYGQSDPFPGSVLAKWVNDGIQKKRFPTWFTGAYNAYRKTVSNTYQEEETVASGVDCDGLEACVNASICVLPEEAVRGLQPSVNSGPLIHVENGPAVDQLLDSITDASLMLFRGTKIGLRGDTCKQQICLTDMWRAVGSPAEKTPSDWKVSKRARDLEEAVRGLQPSVNSGPLIHVENGKPPLTWAHWQLAFGYAEYLSPIFHAWVNQAAYEKASSAKNPKADTQAEAFRLLGWKAEHHEQLIAESRAIAEEARARVENVTAEAAAARRLAEEGVASSTATVDLLAKTQRRVSAVEENFLAVRDKVSELSRREVSTPARPKPAGWKFLAEYSAEIGLPSQGQGKMIANDLVELAKGHVRGLSKICDMDNGLRAVAIAPRLQDELVPYARILVSCFDKFGWRIWRGRAEPKISGEKPHKSFDWVRHRVAMPAVMARLRGEPTQQVLPMEKSTKAS